MGNAAAGDMDDEEYGSRGLWASFGTALRLIVGWFCLAIGVLNLLAEFDRSSREPDGPYLTFHLMLLVGGVVLLALAWIAPSTRARRTGELSDRFRSLAG
jgi:hypothetical protein